MKRLRDLGISVHILEPLHAKHHATSRWSLDVGPYDAHLNALGVRIAMTAAARSIP
jgi:hypothetical protein